MTLVTVDARDFNAEGPATELIKGVFITPLSVRNEGGVLISERRELVSLLEGPVTLNVPSAHYRFQGVGGASIPTRTVFVPDISSITLAELYESYTVDPETLTAEAPPTYRVELQAALLRISLLEAALGIDPFMVIDNGDGTLEISGTAVTDNGDGTLTINDSVVTDNGDGTLTLN